MKVSIRLNAQTGLQSSNRPLDMDAFDVTSLSWRHDCVIEISPFHKVVKFKDIAV